MASALRTGASAGSGVENALMFGLLALMSAPFQIIYRDPVLCDCWGGSEPIVLRWMPIIDNEAAADTGLLGAGSPCPSPAAAGEAFRLTEASMPAGYGPHDFPGKTLYACVRVDAEGQVRGARMLTASGDAGFDRQLVSAARRQWRFEVADPERAEAGWQRVRLNPVTFGGK